MVPEIDVDLNLPPDRRWESLAQWRTGARALLEFYVRDIGGLGAFARVLTSYRDAFVEPEYIEEMRGIARVLDAPEEEVLLANLYYDAMKLVLSTSGVGCTGFVIDTPLGPLHARNLDWTTAENLLASETIIVNFRRGSSAQAYRTVGWPGFAGCFSGVAPGRFCVTLNAVLSEDPPELAAPVSFVLRRVLDTVATFEQAVAVLHETPIASDALLLVSGPRDGEMVVVERSPTRAAFRSAPIGALVVTNDYRLLASSAASSAESVDPLRATSCARYDRASSLLRSSSPASVEACLDVLRDPGVMMGITVQHMVMSAATGELRVELPSR